MAMSQQDNDLLTQTGPGTPMGEMMRRYWAPVIRADAAQAGGAPVPVRIFGQDFVVFRTPDNDVGIIDEACPHRGVSLALARNETGGLRCIFHGWQFDVQGTLIDAPAEPAARRESFCRAQNLPRYRTREAAGLIWAYLGGNEPPPFPDFEFVGLRPEQLFIRRAVVPYNWLQGLEAHLDSSHVPFLHAGSLSPGGHLEARQRETLAMMAVDTAPRLEMEETIYGLREGALRDLGNGKTFARIREAVLPFYTFIPGAPDGHCGGRISVPIDDETSAEWYIVYHPSADLTPAASAPLRINTSPDPDNFAANLGTRASMWHQDREAMKSGHFSGLTRTLPFEDFIVQASMGARVDRSKERLGASDAIIVKARRLLLEAVKEFQRSGTAAWRDGFDYRAVRAVSVTFPDGDDWHDYAWRAQQTKAKKAETDKEVA